MSRQFIAIISLQNHLRAFLTAKEPRPSRHRTWTLHCKNDGRRASGKNMGRVEARRVQHVSLHSSPPFCRSMKPTMSRGNPRTRLTTENVEPKGVRSLFVIFGLIAKVNLGPDGDFSRDGPGSVPILLIAAMIAFMSQTQPPRQKCVALLSANTTWDPLPERALTLSRSSGIRPIGKRLARLTTLAWLHRLNWTARPKLTR